MRILPSPYKTARYKILVDADGSRYRFFCGISGAAIYTTQPIRAETQSQELEIAWEEGRHSLNHCHACDRWVCDAMYNPDVLQCVDCAPLEPSLSAPKKHDRSMAYFGFGTQAMRQWKICSHCSTMASSSQFFCRECGRRLPAETMLFLYQKTHKYCPSCQTVFSKVTDHCPRCGLLFPKQEVL